MKFQRHTSELHIISTGVCFVSVMFVLFTGYQLLRIESESALFLLIVPVFLVSFLGARRLYVNRFRLSCPDCEKHMTKDYKPGVPVTYACSNCGHFIETNITIGVSRHDW